MGSSAVVPASALASQTLISRNPRVVHRNLVDGQGGVLLHLDTGAYHGVNEIGALVWTLLEGEPPFDRLLTELACNVNSVPADVANQISSYLVDLERRDLVRFSDDGVQP